MLHAARDERNSYAAKVAKEIRPFQNISANEGPWDPYVLGS
jgi:hypothetical protein